jgi:hypothetical protein
MQLKCEVGESPEQVYGDLVQNASEYVKLYKTSGIITNTISTGNTTKCHCRKAQSEVNENVPPFWYLV